MTYKTFKRKASNTARSAWKGVKKFTHHRYGTFTKPKVNQLVSDVKMLKSLINVEKKTAQVNNIGTYIPVAQANGAATGASCIDITPVISQGITNTTRNGNSLKLTSACFNMQLSQQASCVNNGTVKYCIVMIPDNSNPSALADVLAQFYEINGFNNVIDSYSNRDSEFYTKFKVLKSGVVRMASDNLAGQQYFKQIKSPLKLGFHLKYDSNASTTTTKNRILLITTADSGNTSSASGFQFQYDCQYWYTDN